MNDWSRWAQSKTAQIKGANRWRETQVWDVGTSPVNLNSGKGREGSVISFATNDYLGLSQDPRVISAARAALERWGAGATSSRFVSGTRPYHLELEEALAEWKRTEKAILFPTGYAANLAVLSAFGGPDVVILSDELNHASIVDGCRLSRSEVLICRHNDASHAAQLLENSLRANARRSIIVTDLTFSMDGDIAPVLELAHLCRRFGSLLILDEAHSVLGPDLHQGELEGIDVLRVGTLSKTFGALGGFVAARKEFIDVLINLARPFRFTTAPTPADMSAVFAALKIINSPEGESLRSKLHHLVEQIKPGHKSPIIPIILGSEENTIKATATLLEQGFYVPAIFPPVVAPGTSRLRLTLSAAHTSEQVSSLKSALTDLIGRL